MEHASAFRRPAPLDMESCVEPQHSITSSRSCTIFEYCTVKQMVFCGFSRPCDNLLSGGFLGKARHAGSARARPMGLALHFALLNPDLGWSKILREEILV
jgi:hypothetical protein